MVQPLFHPPKKPKPRVEAGLSKNVELFRKKNDRKGGGKRGDGWRRRLPCQTARFLFLFLLTGAEWWEILLSSPPPSSALQLGAGWLVGWLPTLVVVVVVVG